MILRLTLSQASLTLDLSSFSKEFQNMVKLATTLCVIISEGRYPSLMCKVVELQLWNPGFPAALLAMASRRLPKVVLTPR